MFTFPGKTKSENFNNIYDKDLEEDEKYVNYVNKFIKSPSKPINFNFNFEEKDKKKDKDENKTKKIMNSAIFSTSKNNNDEKKKMTEKLIDNEEIAGEIINKKKKIS